MRKFIVSICVLISLAGFATNYSSVECQGSLRPYPVPQQSYSYPDTLRPVFINHIGRHGSRYPAASASALLLKRHLQIADSLKTITPLGREFLKSVNQVINVSDGRWGELDSLGMAEQRGIAARMFLNYPSLLEKGNVNAIATQSPRVVMSMYSFTHQLTQLTSNISVTTSEGKKYSGLLRFFDVYDDYMSYIRGKSWRDVYNKYVDDIIPVSPVKRVLGDKYPFTDESLKDLAINQYYLIAGMSAMSLDFDYKPYYSLEEYNKLWSIFNLRQYLQRTGTTVSAVPAAIASNLLQNMISVADSVLTGKLKLQAQLRFAHAETLMPLFSLMQLPHCFYLTYYFDTVSKNWCDFYVVPMAANLQIIYFESESGQIYVRFDLNETPVPVLPDSDEIYVPWSKAREYLLTRMAL